MRQFRWVFIAVFLAIIGVVWFQSVWLYQNYQLSQSHYQQKIDESLDNAMSRYFSLKAAKQKSLLQSKIGGNHLLEYSKVSVFDSITGQIADKYSNGASVIIRVEDDVDTRRNLEIIRHNEVSINKKGVDEFVEKLIPRLLGEIMDENIDTLLLDSLFNAELRARSVPSEGKVFISSQKNDSLYTPAHSTRISLTNSSSVQAIVEDYEIMVIQGMWLSILGSIVMILLLFLSFYFMLRVIFKQKRISEVKNDFINNMTHEFKTPLASIYAAVEAILKFDVLEDKTRTTKYLEMAQGELDRLNGMVQQILNASVNEQETIELNIEKVIVSDLLDQILDRQRLANSKKVTYNFNEIGEGEVWADSNHLHHVLNNLIDNSIKYSSDSVDIKVNLIHHSDHSLLQLSDDGLGMRKEDVSRIFDQFYRVPTGDRHDVKGFGLGLSYVKKIVDLHGWKIEVESTLETGTCFTLIMKQHGQR